MKTIIIDHEPNYFHSIEKDILFSCPEMSISGFASSHKEAILLIDRIAPDLVFMEVNIPETNAFQILKQTPHSNFETIFFAHTSTQAIEAFEYQVSGFILKPLKLEKILPAIKMAEDRIKGKRDIRNEEKEAPVDFNLPNKIIGIPTMEGFEFLPVQEIVRCESYHKCTRVIMGTRSDIISSYNIGEFIKALENSGFYAPHQSHVINLCKVKKYLKEGTIIMQDNSTIPVARRRRNDFLYRMPHV